MPYYVFKNPETEDIVEILQGINDPHKYFDESGTEWERVYTSPIIATDTKINPFSQKQFLDKTAKPGTMGDIWDRSAELSHLRAEKNGGVDPIKEKYKENYSKKRKGRQITE